ncbi:hypothetical protein PPERSA_00099 [Pseudocohnilembus persalinus]|uniref:Uncharacterized protein n=1 Tax=Pseudocohnilembus persalinus TaxID=266149 RepID=A0A0V0Q8I6_PSEPJ|nr:hypothetical protein PPERSA_00099 [Pseudocohnilembus persalinus]|eukprot:KRW98502.1 hypothetical protein PPERSA_00099 [Pseudocohnilembus persalinus]
MTEQYWQSYREDYLKDPMNTNELWVRVQKDLNRKQKPKHHLELYSICKTQNPYIQQIKNSPNITTKTVAELICREKGCELMYCQLMQQKAAENRRSKIDLKGCSMQYNQMNTCIREEMQRIEDKEKELRERVLGIQKLKQEQLELKEKQHSLKQEEKKRVMLN